MTGFTKSFRGAFGLTGAVIALAIPQAEARPLPGSSTNYGVLCTCGDLNFTSSTVVGNVGIANNGAFIGSTANGPGSITGTVEFAAPNTGQYSPDDIRVTGGATFGNAFVQSDIASFNALSQTLSTERGAPLTISAGGSVNASSGIMDAAGNFVFNATVGPYFGPGSTFTINGTSDQTVAINIGATGNGSVAFDGSIVLTGGITPDGVLFNFDSGDYATNTGGDTLTIENGLPTIDPATTGLYFDPNGAIDILDSVIDGRVFGGSTAFDIIGSTINAPAAVPEPGSLALLGAGLLALGVIRRRPRA